MNRYLQTICMTLLLAGFALSSWGQDRNNQDGVVKVNSNTATYDFVPGQLLVKFKTSSPVSVQKVKGKFKSASVSKVNLLLTQFGVDEMEKLLPDQVAGRTLHKAKAFNGEEVKESDLSQLYFIKTKSLRPDSTLLLIKKLKELNEVEYAEPNYKVFALGNPEQSTPEPTMPAAPDNVGTTETETTANVICANPSGNPLYSEQWGIHAVGLDSVWVKPIVNKKRPVIAILDTGVEIDHPDLASNIWTNSKESSGSEGYDDDNNGFADDVHGWDFINNTADIHDWNSHGTHVAGIAAAVDNQKGVVGANPLALIMPVTVMQSDGTGDVATIVKGIDYAVNNGATVLNMSFGTYANSLALRMALANAYSKAVLVAAAGNDGKAIYHECSQINGSMYPAAYSFVFGVQATQEIPGLTGYRASWSNYDCDGATYSAEKDAFGDDGVNYELYAPGANIESSVIGGNYKAWNGTSMAAPLVAGGISAMQMIKSYDSQEVLWGDFIHSSDNTTANINFKTAYNITSRKAELDLVSINYVDSLDGGNGDGQPDAGETLRIYPTIKTTWGTAANIKMNLSVAEGDDASLVEIQSKDVDFGYTLSSYSKEISKNPIIIKISDKVADTRHIRMLLTATCDNSAQNISYDFPIVVNNIVKIGGMLTKNMTLTADKHYLVSSDLAVPAGNTLTIEPGTTVKFNSGVGISSSGKLIIKGTPEKPIIFTKEEGQDFWGGINCCDTLEYCKISYCSNNCGLGLINCEMTYKFEYSFYDNFYLSRCNIFYGTSKGGTGTFSNSTNTNIINIFADEHDYSTYADYQSMRNCNLFNRTWKGYADCLVNAYSTTPIIFKSEHPSYLGTSKESTARKYIYELGNIPLAGCGYFHLDPSYGWLDLSNMPTRPYKEAHGIVWKVVVNGYDAQDEYDSIAPLGVGKQKFEVYFNRPMNIKVAPKIFMGVREPYTQVPIAEDGTWSADSTIYTAYLTITGKTASDGVNRIYVYGAEDNEYFEIPYEKTRFNVNVQAAGSLATGFTGTAGLGKVDLNWNNEHNDITDAIGYNVYRYTMVNDSTASDTIKINKTIIDVDSIHYTDYDVVPGKTYYYRYKTLSSALKEYDVSNTIAITPLTATKGDANGSMKVNISDVVTTVGYVIGNNPKPFIFDAADVNSDKTIDILDVIGIINIVLNSNSNAKDMAIESSATYTVENGTLYVETPVAISGLQVKLNVPEDSQITPDEELNDFEKSSVWLNKNEYMMLVYNMNGGKLSAGKHALLHIGNATIEDLLMSDSRGVSILAINKNATGIKTPEALQFEHPYPNPFSTQLTVPYIIGKDGKSNVEINFCDISGRIIDKYATTVTGMGKYSYTWRPNGNIANGLYLVTLKVDGADAQTIKVIYEK